MAGRNVEILVNARDQASGPLQSVQNRLLEFGRTTGTAFRELAGTGRGFGQLLGFVGKLGFALEGLSAAALVASGDWGALEKQLLEMPVIGNIVEGTIDRISRAIVNVDNFFGGNLRLIDPKAEEEAKKLADEAAKEAKRAADEQERIDKERKQRQQRDLEAHRSGILELMGVESQIAQSRLRSEGKELDARLEQIKSHYAARIIEAEGANKLELAKRLTALRDAEVDEARIADLAKREVDVKTETRVRIERSTPLAAAESRFLTGRADRTPTAMERNTTKLVQLQEKATTLSEKAVMEISRISDAIRGIVPAEV